MSDIVELHRETIDTSIDDLNIHSGNPTLDQDFIVMVPCRNVMDKVLRCLDSIDYHASKFTDKSLAIVLIDDDSTDDTLELAEMWSGDHDYPFTIVSNEIRKYLPRNIYNVVNFVCVNPESVIIQVDGDDYLDPSNNAFEILSNAYDSGAMITFGTYSTEIEGKPLKKFDVAHDTTHPWNLEVCTSWAHLKTYKKKAFDLITVDMMMETDADKWITMGEDAIIQPTIMEHYHDQIIYIPESIYIYDMNGNEHVVNYNAQIYNTFKLKSKMVCVDKSILSKHFSSYDEAIENVQTHGKFKFDYASFDDIQHTMLMERVAEGKRLRRLESEEGKKQRMAKNRERIEEYMERVDKKHEIKKSL